MSPIADLEQVRGIVNKLFNGSDSIKRFAGDDNGDAAATAAPTNGPPLTPTGGDSTNDRATTPQTLDVGGSVVGTGNGGGGSDFLSTSLVKLSSDWCFVDSCTAERFFRVDRAQEHLHYLTDIANESLYILDQDSPTMPPTPEDEILVQNAILQQQQQQKANLSPSESR